MKFLLMLLALLPVTVYETGPITPVEAGIPPVIYLRVHTTRSDKNVTSYHM